MNSADEETLCIYLNNILNEGIMEQYPLTTERLLHLNLKELSDSKTFRDMTKVEKLHSIRDRCVRIIRIIDELLILN